MKPEPETPAKALAARALLTKVARLGDVIGQQTVAEVQLLAKQAAAWLQDNPPGQPVAIEPRGCPTPGACFCVEPTPPAPDPEDVGELIHRLRKREQSLNQQSYTLVQLGDAAYFGRAATRLEQQEDAA